MNKILSLSFSLLTLAPFTAFASPNACGTMMNCGSYKDVDETGSGVRLNIAQAAQANQVNFQWINIENGKDVQTVDLVITFQEDGSFVGLRNSKIYAAGVCRKLACTYGITPLEDRDGSLRTQTGTFRFRPAAVDLTIFAPDMKDGDFKSKGTLTKQ